MLSGSVSRIASVSSFDVLFELLNLEKNVKTILQQQPA
jgi:hypothetical protein